MESGWSDYAESNKSCSRHIHCYSDRCEWVHSNSNSNGYSTSSACCVRKPYKRCMFWRKLNYNYKCVGRHCSIHRNWYLLENCGHLHILGYRRQWLYIDSIGIDQSAYTTNVDSISWNDNLQWWNDNPDSYCIRRNAALSVHA